MMIPLPVLGRQVRPGDLPATLEEMYRYGWAFGTAEKKPAYLYSDLQEWRSLAESLYHGVSSVIDRGAREGRISEGLYAEERAEASKILCCWRATGMGTLVYREEPRIVNPRQANYLRPHLRQLAAQLVGSVSALKRLPTDVIRDALLMPINKGKGAPLFIPGTNKFGAEALAVPYAYEWTLEETDDWLKEMSGRWFGACLTSYLRVQAARKTSSQVISVGGWLYETDQKFLYPKKRRVDGFPFSLQCAVVRFYGLLRKHMTAVWPETVGKIGLACQLFGQYKNAYATDVSQFDDSVSYELYRAVYTDVLGPVSREYRNEGWISEYEYRYLEEFEDWVANAPILAPSPHMVDAARLLIRHGGVPSGSRGTSVVDTIINKARAESTAKDGGLKPVCFTFGDDTLILANEDLDVERHKELNESIGFKLTLAGAPIYLQRVIPTGHTLISRMANACLNREPRSEPTSSIHLATAIRVRKELLKKHPLGSKYLAAIGDFLDGTKVGEDVEAMVNSSASVTDLMKAAQLRAKGTGKESNVISDVNEWLEDLNDDERESRKDLREYETIDDLATAARSLSRSQVSSRLKEYRKGYVRKVDAYVTRPR